MFFVSTTASSRAGRSIDCISWWMDAPASTLIIWAWLVLAVVPLSHNALYFSHRVTYSRAKGEQFCYRPQLLIPTAHSIAVKTGAKYVSNEHDLQWVRAAGPQPTRVCASIYGTDECVNWWPNCENSHYYALKSCFSLWAPPFTRSHMRPPRMSRWGGRVPCGTCEEEQGPVYTIDHGRWKMALFHGPTWWSDFLKKTHFTKSLGPSPARCKLHARKWTCLFF